MSERSVEKNSSSETVLRGEFYLISVVAQRTGLHPQTLRQYDRLGLLTPSRASGRGRRYSEEDIEILITIRDLVREGVNLAGVKRIIELEVRVTAVQSELDELKQLHR